MDNELIQSIQNVDLKLTKSLKTESQNEFELLYAEKPTTTEGQITTTIPHHRPKVGDNSMIIKTII